MKAEFGRQQILEAVLALSLAGFLITGGCSSGQAPAFPNENEGGAPAEQNIGERLFVDTRFAEYFALNMTDVNAPLAAGEPSDEIGDIVAADPSPATT